MRGKKFLALLLAFILALGNLSFAYPSDEMPSGAYYDEDFASAALKLIDEYWEDSYFSTIVMEIGSDKMTVDGKEVEIIPPALEGNEVRLPIIDIAEAVGEFGEANKDTGEIIITADSTKTIIQAPTTDTLSASAYDGVSPDAGSTIVYSSVAENGLYHELYSDGTAFYRYPYATVEEVENALNLNIIVNDGTIMITSPYQMKQLVVQTADGKSLHNAYGATHSINNGEGMYLLLYPSVESTRQAHDKLKQDPGVLYAIPNKVSFINALPGAGSWGTGRISADLMKTHLADEGKTDEEIIVAVIDTGVEATHEHLQGRLVEGKNFIDETKEPIDDHSHGTHVSGTIVDCTPDNVKIMPIKAFYETGGGNDLAIYLGILYAVDNGADILNMSYGGSCQFDEEEICLHELAGNYALEHGVTSVAAAGNNSVDIDTYRICPARLDSVITVAGTASDDSRYSYSNYGDAVDVAAPGEAVYSSTLDNRYTYMTGTSMAAPHVSAAAAMLLLDGPGRTPGELKEILRGMTVDLFDPGHDILSGCGVIDFRRYFGESVPVTELDLWPTSMNLKLSILNYYSDLYIYIEPSTATDKSYTVTSSDPEVAVYEYGTVYAVSPGTATITVTTTSGEISAECEVMVTKANSWIDFAADEYAGGDGSEEDPYLIGSAEQLSRLLYEVRIEHNQYEGYHFKLTDDIDLAGKEWKSIACVYDVGGGGYWYLPFKGSIDGGGHAIKNTSVTEYDFETGFISNWTGGYIKNLALVDANVTTGSQYCGLLVGHCSYVDVSNTYTTGFSYMAAFVDRVDDGVFTNCFSTAKANVAGFSYRLSSDNKVYNCYSAGDPPSSYGAGFVYTLGGAEIVNSFSAGKCASNNGFAGTRSGSSPVDHCYYLADNSRGIGSDYSSAALSLEPKSLGFFQDAASYSDGENWNPDHPWDFENVWAIDPNINGGMPYLKTLPVPPEKEPEEQTNTWLDYAADSFDGGGGTISDPYLIATPEQLAKLSKDYMYGGGGDTWFELTGDIDLSGHNWYPIGKGNSLDGSVTTLQNTRYFSGNILGNGKTVKNLTVSAEGDAMGLISLLREGTVDGLTLKNVNVSGGNYVGGLAGGSLYATITNCRVSGVVSGKQYVGGVLGDNYWASTLSGSSADVTLNGDSHIGGLTGGNEVGILERSHARAGFGDVEGYHAALTAVNTGLIRDCYAFDAPGDDLGGLVKLNAGGKIETSYYIGNGVQLYYELDRTTDAAGMSKTAQQMKDLNTYNGWNFNEIWSIDPSLNNGYPYLKPVVVEILETYWKDAAADSYAGGTGSADDPYLIETPEQLAKMWADFPRISVLPPVRYYKLTNDIDLSGRVWDTLGLHGTDLYAVNIHFDGNGREIRNMTIDGQTGMFAYLTPDSTVKNLSLDVHGSSAAGLAYVTEGLIQDTRVTGSLASTPNSGNEVGGILLQNHGTIERCYSDVILNGQYTSGLVAVNYGEILNSYAVGAIIGCYASVVARINYNLVESCYAAVDILGADTARGLIRSQAGTVRNSYFDEELAYAGAYAGFRYGKNTAQMKDRATYADWDFDGVWGIDTAVNEGYPYLRALAPEPVEPVIELAVSVTTPTIVETLAAYLNIRAGGAPEGVELTAYFAGYETPVAGGAGRMHIVKAPGAGTYRLIVKGDGCQGECEITVREYNTDIWSANAYVLEGRLYVKFNEDMALKSEANCVTILGKTYGAKVLDDKRTAEVTGFDAAGLPPGTEIAVKGVKFPILFPSYSFTFTKITL